MRAASLAVLVVLSAVPAVVSAEAPPPKPAAKPAPKPADKLAPDELAPGTTALAPIKVDSLTLIPLVASAPPATADNLLVLDEAMRTRKVRIHETSRDGDVNELTLTNKAKEPLFLLAGEVIIGGKQDRIIGRNTIIPAKTTQTVPVYCVEHGRWTAEKGSTEFTTANALAHGRLRAKASFANQSQVWSEVAEKNELRKTQSSTDTYRKVATQQSDGTLKSTEKQIRAALDKLPKADRDRMIGYAVAVNGDVRSVDVFASPALFKKLEDKLVRSYLTESVDVVADAKAKAPTVVEVKQFMFDADSVEGELQAYETDVAATTNKGGAKSDKAVVRYKRKPSVDADEDAAPAVFQNYSAH